jgi:tripartite-type tricarboxylate transporter receptor subunit TctC
VTSPNRLPLFPDVPAIAEALPGFESSAWFGLFGPAKLSSELTKRLSEASINAIQTSEVRRRIEAEGATPVGNSPQEFAKFLEIDISRWREVVKFSGAKPE